MLHRLGEQAAGLWGCQEVFECTVELLTGRTHQIRAQLSAAGCPLLGDSLYQPLASPELRQVGGVEGRSSTGAAALLACRVHMRHATSFLLTL